MGKRVNSNKQPGELCTKRKIKGYQIVFENGNRTGIIGKYTDAIMAKLRYIPILNSKGKIKEWKLLSSKLEYVY